MACALCGDICRCPPDANAIASPRWLPDAVASLTAAPPDLEFETLAETPNLHPAPQASGPGDEPAAEDSHAWRQEVAARLNRYQARHKPRPPRYPSLRLRFEDPTPVPVDSSEECPVLSERATSSQALALDSFAGREVHADELPASVTPPLSHVSASQETAAFRRGEELPQPTAPAAGPATAKIIEFPRSWTPAPAPVDELAEPVLDCDRPRILEAPEFIPPPPALGGITIESAQQPETEKRPGIDIPLQSAPLSRRIFAAAIDGVIIAVAGVLFAFIFWKLTAIRPPQFQIIGLAAGLSGLFWAVYQYMLLVYSGTTPGLRMGGLDLARFDGSPAGRRLRRWRVFASFLSAASLGMGYAWVFLDEDSLCWHDRITHTYLAPRK
jgi:uncharacterized RDD family membrane protein YckC